MSCTQLVSMNTTWNQIKCWLRPVSYRKFHSISRTFSYRLSEISLPIHCTISIIGNSTFNCSENLWWWKWEKTG